MDWGELKPGDRVHHFDYGAGTVRSSGPVLLLIDWDMPNGYDYHWTSAIARHLTRHEDSFRGISSRGSASS